MWRAMLDLQCKVVTGEYGAIWEVDEQAAPSPDADGGQSQELPVTRVATYPAKLEPVPDDHPVMSILARAAQSGYSRKLSHVLQIDTAPENSGGNAATGTNSADNTTGTAPPGQGAHVFVTTIENAGQIAAVSTVVAECRDAQVLQATAPLRELAAALYGGFASRADARAHREDAQRVRRAMAIVSRSQDAQGFRGACLNMVNELVRQFDCSRVTLGWVKGQDVHMIAMSDTENLKRHSEQVARIEMAMSECLDQQQPIVYPPPKDAEPMLKQAVVHAHRRVIGQQNKLQMLSVPLRSGDEWLGVLTLERADTVGGQFDGDTVHQLQLIADVVAPQLEDRKHSDRWVIVHAWESVKRLASYLVGPRHIAWKMAGVLVAAILLWVLLGTLPYRVTSEFELQASAKRITPVPFKGRLEEVRVKLGDFVHQGQLLALMDVSEEKLQLEGDKAKLRNAQREYAEALAAGISRGKQAQVEQASAKRDQIQASINLLQYQIDQARITSPISGKLLRGDWHDKVGGVIEMGEQMFEIAPLHKLHVLIHVSESDIDLIDESMTGQLATRSQPGESLDLIVERIIPLAGPVDAENVFQVRAVLTIPKEVAWLRPGMTGLAKIDVGDRPVHWIITHRLIDKLRLWLWW